MTPYAGVRVNSGPLRAAFDARMVHLRTLLAQAMERTVRQAAAYAGLGLEYNHHTYGLRSSIRWGVQVGQQDAVGVVRASAPYAWFVEYGTKAHEIKPRRKHWLRFQQNGAIRFSKGVMHPGTTARHFMRNAQTRAEPLFKRLVAESFAKAFS